MICDVYLYYHSQPGVASRVRVCVISGMGLHLLHLTSSVSQKKTRYHGLIYGLPCVAWYHLGSRDGPHLPGKGKTFLLSSFVPCLSLHFHSDFIGVVTPFYHPHPKVGPNSLSSLKAAGQQLAQGDQFRLEREVRAASSP